MIYYVNTNMGYYGTDDMLEIEADSTSEAYAIAEELLRESLSIEVFESEAEAEDNA